MDATRIEYPSGSPKDHPYPVRWSFRISAKK